MLRFLLFIACVAICSFAQADDPQPLQIQIVVFEMTSSELEAGEDAPPRTLNVGAFDSDAWPDEVIRLRSEGNDVRVQRLTFTAYEALPVQIEMLQDYSVHDDECDAGDRSQSLLDVECTAQRRDDDSYSIELSVREEIANEAPWEQPLLDLHASPASRGTPPEMTSTRTTISATPEDWIVVGGTSTCSTEANDLRRDSSQVILIRLIAD